MSAVSLPHPQTLMQINSFLRSVYNWSHFRGSVPVSKLYQSVFYVAKHPGFLARIMVL